MSFPETPTGSPEAIEASAEMLSQAAQLVGQGGSTLSKTASGLSGVTWSGLAEGRFTAAAGGLAGVCDGAGEALRTCARAAERYSEALERAKRIIEAAREEYEEARAAQVSGAELVGNLSLRRSHADPDSQGDLDDAIADAQDAITAAGDRAQAALLRARRAREEFDGAQQEAIGQLEGTGPGSTSAFGSPGGPAVGGPALAPAFGASGTGGWGSAGGGFGVPAGGLAALSGRIPFDRLGTVDGYAKSAWQERHGQTEVNDLTIGITTAATAGTGGPLSVWASRLVGGVTARGGGAAATGGARTVVGRAGASGVDDAGRAATRADIRAANLETLGDGLGKAGLPFGGEAGKVAGMLSREEVRVALAATTRIQIAAAERETKSRLATLLAAREMSRGVRRGLPDEAIERMMRRANVP